MILKVTSVLAMIVSMASGMISPSETYTHYATLRTGNVRLYWNFNDTHITFEVHAETTGWIGIGFSPNGAMTGADIYIGWVKNGQATVTDRHGVTNGLPPLDPQQDIDVLGGTECDGWTMIKFSRQLAACEVKYDREITQHTQRVLWAWGETDPVGHDVQSRDYHGQKRGAESMHFLQSAEMPSQLPEGPEYKVFEILAENFKIPSEDTYYNCKLFKLPPLSKKHHIVKYEPVIQKGNELNVHHMLVYRCGDILKNQSELERDERCYARNMQHFRTCSTVIAAWAIGAGVVIYPEAAGLSIGDKGDPIYIQLEVHYDNPLMKSDIIDNSGIRFTYTDALRQNDVGLIEIGASPGGAEHIIPPASKHFLGISHCSAECLKNKLDDAGRSNITVFGIMLHAHLAGRSLRLRRIRNSGVELPPLAEDQHYDFNYQETRFIHPHMTLDGKDRLQMECVYNTEDRVNATVGGLGTRNEMCLSFVYYYPKIDLSLCLSSVPKETTFSYFGIDPTSIQSVPGKDGYALDSFSVRSKREKAERMSASDFINQIKWNPQKIAGFENFYNSLDRYELCIPHDRHQTKFTLYNTTEIEFPYVAPKRTCSVEPHPLSQKVLSRDCFAPSIVSHDGVKENGLNPTTNIPAATTTHPVPTPSHEGNGMRYDDSTHHAKKYSEKSRTTTTSVEDNIKRQGSTINYRSGTTRSHDGILHLSDVETVNKSFITGSHEETESSTLYMPNGITIAVSAFLLVAAILIVAKVKQ